MPEEFRTMDRLLHWLGCVSLLLACATARAEDAWTPLFNGKDLSGWHAIGTTVEAWHVEDGVLFCRGGGGGWLSTDKEYANFELELEFRLPPGGNSGVFIRAPHSGDPAYSGMEIQILDDDDKQYANIQPWQHCGSVYGIVAAKQGALKKAGEWQAYNILCNGRKIKITLNGTVIVDANLDDHKDQEASHPGMNRTTGYLGLQNHGTRLDFRNIRIRTLD
jgi:hypothetical protein